MLRKAFAILCSLILPGYGMPLNNSTMDQTSLKKNLAELTHDLLYSSESDYPFEIIDWENKKPAELKATLASPVNEISAENFFSRYINILQTSDDAVRQADAPRYKKLKDFIISNAASVTVWRSGKIEVAIYIVITAKDDHLLALKTTSVET
jgi:Nuclease A inhibitor-like protein